MEASNNSSFCSMRRLKPWVKIALTIVSAITLLLVLCCFIYKLNIRRVSKSEVLKEIEITSGHSYLTISEILKENNIEGD